MSDNFNPIALSSKIMICGLPIRVDSYRYCTFGCKYCFANNRQHMCANNGNKLEKANPEYIDKVMDKQKREDPLSRFIDRGITWHFGGMSDPFQPCEEKYGITKQIIDKTNNRKIHILFSTKTDTLYDVNVNPELHSFQLSISNVHNRKDIEPNVPDIEKRYQLFKNLKKEGFKVGIRIQPFIPGVSDTDIIDMFRDADNITIECIKFMKNGSTDEERQVLIDSLGLSKYNFKCHGNTYLINSDIRVNLYKPFIKRLESYNMKYSVSDNDLRDFGNNICCCGDRLIEKSTRFDTTAMLKKYGEYWTETDLIREVGDLCDCDITSLFYSGQLPTEYNKKLTIKDNIISKFNCKNTMHCPEYQKAHVSDIMNTAIDDLF